MCVQMYLFSYLYVVMPADIADMYVCMYLSLIMYACTVLSVGPGHRPPGEAPCVEAHKTGIRFSQKSHEAS